MAGSLGFRTPGIETEWLTLSADDTEALARMGKSTEIKEAKTTIFNQGQAAHKLYLLMSGIVRVSRVLPDGERHIVAFHWPGDLFGMEAEGLYLDHAESVTPCMICEFSADHLREFLLSHPDLQQTMLVKAVHSLRAAQRQLIVVGRLDVHRAIASFLLDCTAHDKYFNAARSTLTLPMSRYDIADYLGTATESVTRAMTRLETEGLIRRATPRELLLNLPGLKHLANLD